MRTSPHPPRSASATSSQRASLSGPRSCRVSARRRGGAPGAVDGVLLAAQGLSPPRRGRGEVTACREGAPCPFGFSLGRSRVSACFCVLSLCALIAVRGAALALTSVCVAGLPWPRAGDVATSGRSGRRVWALPSLVAQERVRPGSAWPFPRWSRDVDGLHPGRVQGGRRRPPHVSEGDAMVPSLTQPPVFLPLLLSSR